MLQGIACSTGFGEIEGVDFVGLMGMYIIWSSSTYLIRYSRVLRVIGIVLHIEGIIYIRDFCQGQETKLVYEHSAQACTPYY